eukprot:14749397-Ditylum_brightwellii.AAC.1
MLPLQNTLVVCGMDCLPCSTHKMMTATWLQAASTYMPSQTYLDRTPLAQTCHGWNYCLTPITPLLTTYTPAGPAYKLNTSRQWVTGRKRLQR